jgi:uncharacterized circularly permuted ATP-grasp superfamily protein/uncharacterized alpha-E superfamily protein
MNSTSLLEGGAALGSVLSGYAGLDSAFDELVGPDGSLRSHWQTFAEGLGEIGLDDFTRRWREAQQLIRENGVTYNLHGDPGGMDRPWQLDPFPLVISPRESDRLQAGLVQRSRLLEAILADVYGPQRLLAEGLLPPELVFANPSFLRPCHGVGLPGHRYLHLVAFDLGRDPSGNVRVLSERTQSPAGAGYALENRIVLGRMLPEVFKACNVQRLALFFRTFRDTLRSLAPHNRDTPRTVLLTPGPSHETYFEHAFLARYLGYTLAEGADLTVRDQRLYLKLLDGLQSVDVVWRRLDDDQCDPLELRGDSFLGVPGLVQVVRAGNVVIANGLGSGLGESVALLPYLPALCRHYLSEDLLIPSVPAFWCGDGAALEHVLADLSHMVIKPAFSSLGIDPIFPEELSRKEREELIVRIRAKPWAFVGQEHLTLSTTPVLTEHGIVPRHTVTRVYLAAIEGGFMLMPGGLTRVTASTETMVVSLQKGGGSKDTWVLTEGPVSDVSLLRPAGKTTELTRAGNDLPSRAADNLFWLGRYVQRAEDMVRLLRGILVCLTEGIADVPELPTLLQSLTHLTQALPGFVGSGAEDRLANPEPELFSLIFQGNRIGSLSYNYRCIHRAAASVRDRISTDMWRILSSLPPHDPYDPAHPPTLSDVLDLLNQRVVILAGFGGIAMESMTRGHGWRFLDMGRKIERAAHTVGLLHFTLTANASAGIGKAVGARSASEEPASSLAQASASETGRATWEGPLLEALLEIADSSMTYRRRYLGGVQAAAVLDLLIADESNPRSLVYLLKALREVIDRLPHDPQKAVRSPEQRMIVSLLTAVQLADIQELARPDETGRRPGLEDFLADLHQDLPLLADAISHHYLSHLETSRQLAGALEHEARQSS